MKCYQEMEQWRTLRVCAGEPPGNCKQTVFKSLFSPYTVKSQ